MPGRISFLALMAMAGLFLVGCRQYVEVTGQPQELAYEKPPYQRWNGKPSFERIPGTEIICIKEFKGQSLGPEYDICKVGKRWYWPYKGHWFKARRWRGPWKFAREVPNAFLRIPKGHDRYRIAKLHPGYKEK